MSRKIAFITFFQVLNLWPLSLTAQNCTLILSKLWTSPNLYRVCLSNESQWNLRNRRFCLGLQALDYFSTLKAPTSLKYTWVWLGMGYLGWNFVPLNTHMIFGRLYISSFINWRLCHHSAINSLRNWFLRTNFII